MPVIGFTSPISIVKVEIAHVLQLIRRFQICVQDTHSFRRVSILKELGSISKQGVVMPAF